MSLICVYDLVIPISFLQRLHLILKSTLANESVINFTTVFTFLLLLINHHPQNGQTNFSSIYLLPPKGNFGTKKCFFVISQTAYKQNSICKKSFQRVWDFRNDLEDIWLMDVDWHIMGI